MKILVIVLILTSIAAEAQFMVKESSAFRFFRARKEMPSYQSIRSTPSFQVPSLENSISSPYWQGASYTSYSENGRLRSIHTFDVQGQLRETRASFSLKKNGILSSWRIQVSSRRNSPLFIYTIPR
jgi:hypothetical protein